ncbi:MAG: hypothetical protein LBB77_06205 [Treponema sp.]|jgi:hypothetical protein|nr:hypothetical protein [Treponema sp.]
MGCFVPPAKKHAGKAHGIRTLPLGKALHIGLLGWLSLAVICAGVYIIEEQDHDCCGEGCPICLRIAFARRLIEAFGCFCVSLLLAAFLAGLVSRAKSLTRLRVAPATLVALKIKFNC